MINEVIKINQNTNKRLDNIEKKINLNKEEINNNMGNMQQINIPKTKYINNNKNNKPISKQKNNYLSFSQNIKHNKTYENNHTLSRSQNFNDEIDYFENDSAHNSANSLNEFYSEEEFNDNENNYIKCIKEDNTINNIEINDSQDSQKEIQKKRGKYRKNMDKSEFEKSIQYIEYIDDNKKLEIFLE